MLRDTAIAHFGSRYSIAQALKPDWSTNAVYLWRDIVPLAAARKLSALSGGKLEVIEDFYDSKGNIIRQKRKKRVA